MRDMGERHFKVKMCSLWVITAGRAPLYIIIYIIIENQMPYSRNILLLAAAKYRNRL